MSVGVWEPETSNESSLVELDLIERFVKLAEERSDVVDVQKLEAADLADKRWVITAGADAWEGAKALDSDAVICLVRLFTLLEDQLSGWEAGRHSPVIPLVKILKERDNFGGELRRWIKSNTKNRYLPHGSAL